MLISSSEGVYTAPSLAPGEYRVDVELSGFKPVRRDGVRVLTGEKARVDFDLAVGGVCRAGHRHRRRADLRAETASLGDVVEHEQVVQLPLNGRAFIMLASLAPGVALPPNSQLPRINGGRPRTNEYLFDGISVLQPEPGQVAYLSGDRRDPGIQDREQQPAGRVRPLQRRRRQPDDEGGRECVSRRRLRVLRNEALNARNYFQSTNPVKPDYRRNQFGGTLGGPLVKDHTFFFVDYQGQRQSIGRTVTSTVPTLLQRQGIFTEAIAGTRAGDLRSGDDGRIGADGVSRQHDPGGPDGSGRAGAAAALSAADVVGTANNYSRTDNEIDNQDQWDVRIDHRFSTNTRSGVRPPRLLPRRLRAGDAAARRQRRHERHARPAGHHGLGVRVELPAHVFRTTC